MASMMKKLFRACILAVILYLCPELPPLFALPFTKKSFYASSAGRSLSCTSPWSHFDQRGVATGTQHLWNSLPVKDMNPTFFFLSQDCYIYTAWILSTAPLFMWSVPWPGCHSSERGLPAPSCWQLPANKGISNGSPWQWARHPHILFTSTYTSECVS